MLNSATGESQANEDLCVYIQDWQADWALDSYLWGREEEDGGASQWKKKLSVFPEWSPLLRCLLPTHLPNSIYFYHLRLSCPTSNITNLLSNLHCTSVLILRLIFRSRVWALSIFLSLQRQKSYTTHSFRVPDIYLSTCALWDAYIYQDSTCKWNLPLRCLGYMKDKVEKPAYMCMCLCVTGIEPRASCFLVEYSTIELYNLWYSFTTLGPPATSNLVLSVLLQISFFVSFLSEMLSLSGLALEVLLEFRYMIAAHSEIWILCVSRALILLSLPLLSVVSLMIRRN